VEVAFDLKMCHNRLSVLMSSILQTLEWPIRRMCGSCGCGGAAAAAAAGATARASRVELPLRTRLLAGPDAARHMPFCY
jgi:hypothetical protein